jgi:disulfide bond formation protein DsbB
MTASITSEIGAPKATGEGTLNVWTWLALLVAAVAVAGSLFLSLGMGLKACPLCFYQRTFVMAELGILLVGVLAGPRDSGLLGLLALPPALGALGVAAFHVNLEVTGKLECPAGIIGVGTAPQQSLAALAILAVVLLISVIQARGIAGLAWVAGTIVLGALFAYGCIVGSPPMPPAPTKAYEQPLEICRPPYRGS